MRPSTSGRSRRGTEEAGIRCVLSKIVSSGKGGPAHLARWDGHPLIHPSLAIAVPEDATRTVIKKTADLCAEAGAVLQVHVNEHLASVERSLKSVGRRPLEHLHHIGALGPHTLGAHATLLTPAEMRHAGRLRCRDQLQPGGQRLEGQRRRARPPCWPRWACGSAWAPTAPAPTASGWSTPPRPRSGWRTDGHGRLRRAAPGGCGWTTRPAGADALGLGKVTGEIAVGKAADFLVVDLRVPELTPSYDLRWELVRLADRDQITAVVVGGRLRLWQGWPPDWDGRALVARAAEAGPGGPPGRGIARASDPGSAGRGEWGSVPAVPRRPRGRYRGAIRRIGRPRDRQRPQA